MLNTQNNRLRAVGNRGFTLVELMVALAISSFLVVTMFYVLTAATKTFRVQNDISQVTDRMNYSMDTIKNDLRRASFMTIPNAYLQPDVYPWYRKACAPPAWMDSPTGNGPAAHAVWVREGSGGSLDYYEPAADEEVLIGENPDQLILFGAYRTVETFQPTLMQSGTSMLRVSNGGFTDVEMDYIFSDAVLMISTPAGGHQYLSVTDASAIAGKSETELTLGQALLADPLGTGLETCNFQGFGGLNFEVTPMHFVQYSLLDDPDDYESSLLVREELGYEMQSLTPASRYIVARDIVDFQVWFDGVVAGGSQTTVLQDGIDSGDWVDDEGTLAQNLLDGDANAQPENARSAYIQISSRLDTAYTKSPPPRGPLLEFIQLNDCEDDVCVPAGDFTPVYSIRGEVQLPNILLSNVRSQP